MSPMSGCKAEHKRDHGPIMTSWSVPQITMSFWRLSISDEIQLQVVILLPSLQFHRHCPSCIMVLFLASSVPLCQSARFYLRAWTRKSRINDQSEHAWKCSFVCYLLWKYLVNCSKVFVPRRRHIIDRLAHLLRGRSLKSQNPSMHIGRSRTNIDFAACAKDSQPFGHSLHLASLEKRLSVKRSNPVVVWRSSRRNMAVNPWLSLHLHSGGLI